MKVAFVTNLCTHYRRPLFEELSRRLTVDFFFTSEGHESYWLDEHDLDVGTLRVRPERTPVGLGKALARGSYDCVISTMTGRATLAATYLTARATRIPFIAWVGIWSHPTTLFHRVSRPLARSVYRGSCAIVTYGSHVSQFVEREAGRTHNVFVASHSVDNERFRVAATAGSPRPADGLAQPIFLYVGRLVDEKGIDVLLEAMTAVPSGSLLVVGTGRDESTFRQRAADLGVAERVRWAGYVDQQALPGVLTSADALILPSVTTRSFREPWGLVVNEAMNAGLPVVVTTAVGAAAGGLVVDGVTGLVVPEANAPAMAGAMRRLGDKQERERLGRAGSEHVLQWNYGRAADAFVSAVRACRRDE